MTAGDGTSLGDDLGSVPRDPLEGLEAARDNLQAAEKLLEETRAELLERLHSVGNVVPQTAREAVLNEIYWRWPKYQQGRGGPMKCREAHRHQHRLQD